MGTERCQVLTNRCCLEGDHNRAIPPEAMTKREILQPSHSVLGAWVLKGCLGGELRV